MKKKVSKPGKNKVQAKKPQLKKRKDSKDSKSVKENKKKEKKETKAPSKQNKESEISSSQGIQSNKAEIGELEEISKRSEMPKVKIYEIKADEQTSYLLNFEQVKDKLKIKVTEKDSFPKNEYENYYSLEDLIKLDEWFKIFYNIESLIIEFEK